MSRVSEERQRNGRRTIDLSESEVFGLLSSERRRIVIDALADLGPPLGLNELAREVANREARAGAPSTGAINDVKIALHHHHLPKLADLGLIEYFPDAHWIPSMHVRLDELVG